MLNPAKVISGFSQMRDLQSNQVYICVHSSCDLLRGISVVIDILKQLIGIKKDFRSNNVCLILRLRSHVVKHELLQCVPFGKVTVQLVMSQLVGADNTLHSRTQILVDKNETIALDHTVHTLERTEVITKQDLYAKLLCYAKRISCAAASYEIAADFREMFSTHRSTSIRGESL